MGYVQEYGKGKFRARKRVDGKLVSKSFDSRAAAYAWVDAEEIESQPPPTLKSSSPNASALTLRQFYDRGGHVTAHLKPSAAAHVDTLARTHLLPRFGDDVLAEITHAELQHWLLAEVVNGRVKAGADGKRLPLSPQTVKHVAKVTHQVFASAMKAGLIPANPAAGLITPRIDREEMRFLDPTEVAKLAAAIDEPFGAWVYLAAYSGLRIGEMFALRWTRVDLFAGRVDVAETVAEVNGRLIVGTPKTRAARRTVSIPRSVVRIMSDYRSGCGASPLVFPAPSGDMFAPSNFRRRIWAPAVAAAGLEGLRPHDLRHTAVALWIAAGASPKEVAVRAGHTSVSFSLDRYGHLFPVQDERLAGKLDRMFTKGL